MEHVKNALQNITTEWTPHSVVSFNKMTQYSDCECGIANAASRIVNGVPTEENEYPWQVVVYTSPGGGFCGGTIINKRFV